MILPCGICVLSIQMAPRIAQRRTQPASIFDGRVQHELLVPVAVYAQEPEHQLIATAPLIEELSGKSAVEKLDATTDRTRFMQLGKSAAEGCEIQFERPSVVGERTLNPAAPNEALLEGQELADLDGLGGQRLEVYPQVFAFADSRAKGEVEPVVVEGSFLRPACDGTERALRQPFAAFATRDFGEGILELAPAQEFTVEASEVMQQPVRAAAFADQELVQVVEKVSAEVHATLQVARVRA